MEQGDTRRLLVVPSLVVVRCDLLADTGIYLPPVWTSMESMTDKPLAQQAEEATITLHSVLRRMAVTGQSSEALNRLVDEGDTAIASAVRAATSRADADHEWRKSMEAYGFDSVAKVLDMVRAARVEVIDWCIVTHNAPLLRRRDGVDLVLQAMKAQRERIKQGG